MCFFLRKNEIIKGEYEMKRNKINVVVEILVLVTVLSVALASTVMAEVPGVPRSFHVISGDGSVDLSWSEPVYDDGLAITGYRIYRGIMPDGLGIVDDVTDMFYTDSGLENGQPYYYAVSALNAEGEGGKTEILEATPASSTPLMTELTLGDWTAFRIINVGEGVYFDIAGGTHTMVVKSVTNTEVLISISWDSQSLTMSEGDSKKIDVNGDGKYDFKITCVEVISEPSEGFPQTAEFSFTKNIKEDGTPGFESIFLLIAVVVSILIWKRKRI